MVQKYFKSLLLKLLLFFCTLKYIGTMMLIFDRLMKRFREIHKVKIWISKKEKKNTIDFVTEKTLKNTLTLISNRIFPIFINEN